MVPEAYSQAVEEQGVEPIDKPQVEVIKIEEDEPLLFKATVEVKPEVKLGEYKGLSVKKKKELWLQKKRSKEFSRICGSAKLRLRLPKMSRRTWRLDNG